MAHSTGRRGQAGLPAEMGALGRNLRWEKLPARHEEEAGGSAKER